VQTYADNHLIIRTAWLYGIGNKNFLKTMLRLALADPERTIRVVNDQHGSLTWSWRLARQIERLLDSDLRGIVHATAEGHSTWYEGARCFLDAMGVPYAMEPCTTADYPTPAHRPANSILENCRMKEAGINCMAAWRDDVQLFAERYRDRLLAEARG
jgi:dTDP-4-dehydrorhamnose reductase